jgi:hypothetical protein
MEVITIESKIYKEIISKLDKITAFVIKHADDDEWVDGYDVCKYLKVSSRTLQRLRSKGLLNYSVSSGKAMYKMGEVRRMLEQNLIKSNPQNFQDLLNNYKKHAE